MQSPKGSTCNRIRADYKLFLAARSAPFGFCLLPWACRASKPLPQVLPLTLGCPVSRVIGNECLFCTNDSVPGVLASVRLWACATEQEQKRSRDRVFRQEENGTRWRKTRGAPEVGTRGSVSQAFLSHSAISSADAVGGGELVCLFEQK